MKQFCLRGHDTFAVGRIDGHCQECERNRKATPEYHANRAVYQATPEYRARKGVRRRAAYLADPEKFLAPNRKAYAADPDKFLARIAAYRGTAAGMLNQVRANAKRRGNG